MQLVTMKTERHEVVISYPFCDWPDGDRDVERIAGIKAGASGTNFGERDLHFYFDNHIDAEEFASRMESEKAVRSEDWDIRLKEPHR